MMFNQQKHDSQAAWIRICKHFVLMMMFISMLTSASVSKPIPARVSEDVGETSNSVGAEWPHVTGMKITSTRMDEIMQSTKELFEKFEIDNERVTAVLEPMENFKASVNQCLEDAQGVVEPKNEIPKHLYELLYKNVIDMDHKTLESKISFQEEISNIHAQVEDVFNAVYTAKIGIDSEKCGGVDTSEVLEQVVCIYDQLSLSTINYQFKSFAGEHNTPWDLNNMPTSSDHGSGGSNVQSLPRDKF